MLPFRHPDTPMEVSIERLKHLDDRLPGFWIAQPKLDGHRLIALRNPDCKNWKGTDHPHVWQFYKKSGAPAKLDPALRAEFESMPWPDGIGLDCEQMGLRDGGAQSIWIFDVLYLRGRWHGNVPFEDRLRALSAWKSFKGRVRVMPDSRDVIGMYAAQTTDPMSEGVVVRRKDSIIMGGAGASLVNAMVLKSKFCKRVEQHKGAKKWNQ